MNPPKKFVLVGEPAFSWGRIVALTAVFGICLASSLTIIPDSISGKIYRYSLDTWIITIFCAGFFIFLIVGGLVWHRRQQWPEFIIYFYEDRWTRALFKELPRVEDWYGDLPPSLICSVSKYKKKYSKKKKNWYIRLSYNVYYKKDVYGIDAYGWVKEPKDIKEWDKFVETLRRFAEENRKKKKMKIPPRILWFGLYSWRKLDYAQKLWEEREKQLGEKYGKM